MVIAPQTVEHNRTLTEERRLPFQLLSDPGNETASRFGLTFALPDDLKQVYRGFGLDLPDYNGDQSWTLPMPARFVSDEGGVIVSAEADPDYTRRPEPEDTLAVVRSLIE